MSQPAFTYSSFMQGAAILLSVILSVLIALPLAASMETGAFVIPAFAAFGALIGYRRRRSRLFLYFCMLGILTVSVIISFSS